MLYLTKRNSVCQFYIKYLYLHYFVHVEHECVCILANVQYQELRKNAHNFSITYTFYVNCHDKKYADLRTVLLFNFSISYFIFIDIVKFLTVNKPCL